MSKPLHDTAAELPTSAGVYLFKDHKGKVLYVGKAGNLRGRVRQYLAGHDDRAMVPFLVRHAHDLDVIVTSTEKEALLLENTLIKKHRPRFNVRLRDDSNFLHLRLDTTERWPRYRLVRRIESDGARYFGPYASAQKARQTLTWLTRAFPLRTCTDATLRSRRRPCLMHQLGRCVAPCVEGVDEAAYLELAEDSTHLLLGRIRPAMRAIEKRMFRHADKEQFEEAARLRDLVASIRDTVERQQVIDPRLSDRDVWGLYREGTDVAVALVPVREGVMQEPLVRVLSGVIEDDAELLSSVLNTAYVEGSPIPGELLVPAMPRDADALASVLSERRGTKVSLRKPVRGSKVRLLELANENARVRFAQQTDADALRSDAMQRLGELVGLDRAPHRMECFDNSHLGGDDPVAAMAVFLDGQPARAEYRRYKIKIAPGGDDYAGMREVLTRRFKRTLEDGAQPDLLVVDGGKGQLAVAMAVLQDLGVGDQAVIGISKPRTEHAAGDRKATDKIVLPNVKDPVRLRRGDLALRILQHLRDETHNHAVRYQRKVRQKSKLKSGLEDLRGVGPSRRRALLTTFGSARGVIKASVEELAAVDGIGPQLATSIHTQLRGG